MVAPAADQTEESEVRELLGKESGLICVVFTSQRGLRNQFWAPSRKFAKLTSLVWSAGATPESADAEVKGF